MATSTIRSTVKSAVVAVLQSALPGVQISYSLPAEVEREAIWLGPVEGGHERPAMKGGTRFQRIDTFSVVVNVQVITPGLTAAQADERVEELVAAVESALATDETLSSVGGLKDGFVDSIDGPDPGQEDEGYWSKARITLQFVAHLT